MTPIPAARTEYPRRVAARRAEADRLRRLERAVSNARLIVFLIGILSAWVAIDAGYFSPWWAALPGAVFAGLVVRHDRVIKDRSRAERATAFYERGLARLEDRWGGTGETGERFHEPAHPYAADLDLFGQGSLFQLLCTARTLVGEETLARWLLAPATPQRVGERQHAAQELQPRLDLREDVALVGADVRAHLDPQVLTAWAAAPPLPHTRASRSVAGAAALGVLGTLLLAAFTAVGWLPFAGALGTLFGVRWWLGAATQRLIHGVEHPARDLAVFAQLLARLEGEPFAAPRLVELRRALDTGGAPPSARIAQLHRLVHLLDARKNLFFAPIAVLSLWDMQVAWAIEAWRVDVGPAIGRWLATVGEIEALLAIASHAYEHPDDVFPLLVEGPPRFVADGLGHPLLPEGRCIRNDLRLDGAPGALVVSGSNMSGKSTLLRAVGTNAVLALAGAPVRARRLSLAPLAVGASIRTLDSLQEGTSRFYAEITRLRQLMELATGARPLLFLLDEILHGTNSHDRGIGAEAVLRGFLQRGAIGLVTTHDLALARVADTLAPVAANVHFEDHLENGTMCFDYRMQPGVVTHSNALALMRAVGLEV